MSVKKLLSETQYNHLYDQYHEFLKKAHNEKKQTRLHEFFEELRKEDDSFLEFSDKELSNKIIASRRIEGEEEWPNLRDADKYINPQIRNLIKKAHNSALLAVEIYNKPIISYRTEGFIVMMMIAWTALFHAIFLYKNESIKYRKDDSEEDYFDLRKCVRKFEGKSKKEIEANLSLLIDIRDRIVHRDNTEIDDRLFGYCQACLLNFETLLISTFGNKHQLPNSLAFSLQFSRRVTPQQSASQKHYQNKNTYELMEFLNNFESSLFLTSPDVYRSQEYCFRVLLIPKFSNERNADAAVEYVDYDSFESEEKEKIDKAVLIVKEIRSGGKFYKASDVSKIIQDRLKDRKGPGWRFSASYHHALCVKYFKIREGYKTEKPDITKREYCEYDSTFNQYIYTKQWINFLVNQLEKDEIYNKIFSSN